MKSYKIVNKTYTSLCIPISDNETLVIPPRGQSKTVQFMTIPNILYVYKEKNIISIQEL